MHVDAITLAAIADEWRKLLINARIDTIIQPTEYGLALQCYAPAQQGLGSGQNYWLYLSAHPQLARAHLTRFKPAKIASEPPAFAMLLRKHLEGARIEEVTQTRWERVLELVIGYRSNAESDERVHFRLIMEIMGRMSNLILCDEQGMILGSLKRVGADVNRYRTITTGIAYVPPPPQQRSFSGQTLPRIEATTVTAAQLSILAAEQSSLEDIPPPTTGKGKGRKQQQGPTMLWQLLTRHLLGFSPLLARECVYRTTEDSETAADQASEDVWEELAWNVRDLATLYDTHSWHPQLIIRTSTASDPQSLPNPQQPTPLAYAPYTLDHYAQQAAIQVEESPSINMLLDDFYAQAEWRDAVDGVRLPIRKALQTQFDRCARKAELLRQEMSKTEEAARYRQHAELLLAHQHEVTQGQTTVRLPDFTSSEDAETLVTIPLDPRFDAIGNANRLFNKYHKLRRATALLPAQIEQNDAEQATIAQILADLMLAENPAEILLVKAEVQAAGYIRGKSPLQDKKPKKGKSGKQLKGKGKAMGPGGGMPLHIQSDDGFTLLIGKNSRQNEEVTFHQATSNDIWLHARGVPGSHVIIKAAGREVPHRTIEQAASLAAYYSQARGSTSVLVDYTQQRHVRHMKGAGPGMVIYEHERTIHAIPTTSSSSGGPTG